MEPQGEHKFTDRWSLSGFYVYNSTTEPATESMPASHDYMDGAYDLLERRPHLLVFNNTNILNDTTILTLRYGWTTWMDQNERVPFPAGLASLGFSPNFVNAVHPDGRDLFPISISTRSATWASREERGGGGRDPVPSTARCRS